MNEFPCAHSQPPVLNEHLPQALSGPFPPAFGWRSPAQGATIPRYDPTCLTIRIPALPRLAPSQRWCLGGLASVLFHGLLVLVVVGAGLMTGTPEASPPLLIEELSLDGLAGPGGSGGDGRASGGSPAAQVPAAQPAAAEPARATAPTPPAAAPEVAPQAVPIPAQTPPEPEKQIVPEPTPKPEPKPVPKPKPIHRPKVVHKAAPVAPAAPAAPAAPPKGPITSEKAPATGQGTGLGSGQGLGGNGTGLGRGQGNGPPGVGGGPGGGGGGSAVGQFGQGDGPHFRHRCLPRYPDAAKASNKEGNVALLLSIDDGGVLRDVKVLEHSGLEFVNEALRAIRSSTYLPAMRQGHAIPCRARLNIRFKLH